MWHTQKCFKHGVVQNVEPARVHWLFFSFDSGVQFKIPNYYESILELKNDIYELSGDGFHNKFVKNCLSFGNLAQSGNTERVTGTIWRWQKWGVHNSLNYLSALTAVSHSHCSWNEL